MTDAASIGEECSRQKIVGDERAAAASNPTFRSDDDTRKTKNTSAPLFTSNSGHYPLPKLEFLKF